MHTRSGLKCSEICLFCEFILNYNPCNFTTQRSLTNFTSVTVRNVSVLFLCMFLYLYYFSLSASFVFIIITHSQILQVHVLMFHSHASVFL